MEGYTTPESYDVEPPSFMGEDDEDGVLRFWASHPEDLDELLSSLPPLADETVNSPAPPPPPPPPQESTYCTWAPAESVQVVAANGIGGHDMLFSPAVGDGDLAAIVGQAATGGIPLGLAGAAVVPRAAGLPALAMVADFWIPYSGPDCTVCGMLRDIIHTNDRFSMKLSIHGNLGFVDHALLVIHHFLNEIMEEKYIADLRSMDVASLRQFFVDYGYCCYRLGQVLVMDTHRELYNVLAVNMDAVDEDLPADPACLQAHHDELAALVAPMSPEVSYPGLAVEAGGRLPPAAASQDSDASEAAGADTDDSLKSVVAALLWAVPELRLLLPLPAAVAEEPEPSSPPNYLLLDPDEDDLYVQRSWGLHSTAVRRVAGFGSTALGVHQMTIRKSGIAAQRERTGLLEFGDIARVFHLPITYAARELQICTTALKKVCRRYHVYRWPHRKVLSSAKRIESLKESLKVQRGLESARTVCLLYAERRELRSLYRVKV